nr:thioredoxin TrxC [Dechloromonas sp.]
MSESLHLVCPHCDAVNRLPAERLGQNPSCGQCKQALFDGEPAELNAANFDRHTSRNDLPVVVDFWAPWCGPCRVMAPNFHQAAIDLEPQARLVKVNTEDEQQLAARFNIRSIPTLAIFKNGREVARQSGALDLGSLKRWITPHLYKA